MGFSVKGDRLYLLVLIWLFRGFKTLEAIKKTASLLVCVELTANEVIRRFLALV